MTTKKQEDKCTCGGVNKHSLFIPRTVCRYCCEHPDFTPHPSTYL